MNEQTSKDACSSGLSAERFEPDNGGGKLRVDDYDSRCPSRSTYARVFKPAFDLLAALLLAVALSPLILAIALAVRIKLGGPALIRQERIGLAGKPFRLLKFRTMLPDRRSPDGDVTYTGPERRHVHKSSSDPRHTTTGRMLRKYGLDELPQICNVARREMSLIGPRPEMPDIVETKYQPGDHRRHLVRPGLIGLWQVTKRGDHDLMYQDVAVDLRYIDTVSLKTDIVIALAMVRNILTRSHLGA
jgi:lipopolysaccharide/colanic/teichoic acid biosynthesis glycosyltransferase